MSYDIAFATETLTTETSTYTYKVTRGGYVVDGKYHKQGSACHSWLNPSYGVRTDADSMILSCSSINHTEAVSEDVMRRWYEFVASTAFPFSQFILVKDLDFLVEKGLILGCGPNYSSVISKSFLDYGSALFLCKSFRRAHEENSAVITWDELTRRGVHPMLAFWAGEGFYRSSDGTWTPSGNYEAIPSSHGGVWGNTNIADKGSINLRRMILNEVSPHRGTNTNTVFATSQESNLFLTLKNKCKTKGVSDGWGGHVAARGISIDDVASILMQTQKEYL